MTFLFLVQKVSFFISFCFFFGFSKFDVKFGRGSKFSNLQQVGDFSIFGSIFWGGEGHKI